MKKMKKVFAVMLSLAMVLGMAMTVSAAPKKPVATDDLNVTIKNVKEGSSYKAYQIIDATYNDEGFTGYAWVEETGKSGEVKFKKVGEETVVDGLTSDFITELAADMDKLASWPTDNKKDSFSPTTDKLTAGTWMIIVTPPANEAVVYNPMVVSVYYTVSGSDNDLTSDILDAKSDWGLEQTGAFAKSSEVLFDKKLDNSSVDTEVKVGQDVSFTIESEMPSYSKKYYTNPTFKITDTIVNGLQYNRDVEVYVGGTDEVNKEVAGEETFSLSYVDKADNNKASFTVDFADSYIWGLADKNPNERKIYIKYSAKITDDAVKKIGENEAKLDYSRTPTEVKDKKDKEQIFTFALNGVFEKTDEDKQPLQGATFTLYEAAGKETTNVTEIKWSTEETVYGTVFGNPIVTDANGSMNFKGLDGDKTYYLMETAAPDMYSINDTIYKIEIIFDKNDTTNIDENGKATYTISVTKNKLAEGETENDRTKTFTVTIDKADSEDVNIGEFGGIAMGDKILIPNTKLSSLPSTGGIGTTIFTIGGCAIMIIAAGLFFASRRKSSKDAAKEG